jgi:hypothetical protein
VECCRVVDEAYGSAQRRRTSSNESFDGRDVRQVCGQDSGLSARGDTLGSQVLGFISGAAAMQADLPAQGGEIEGQRAADAARGTCNQDCS